MKPLRVASLIDALERAEVIDRWSRTIRPVVQRAVGDGLRRDVATGGWLGHPLHPAAVTVPLACWFGSTVLDVVGGHDGRGIGTSSRGARGGLGDPGRGDGRGRLARHRRRRTAVGTCHAAAMNAAALIYAWSWFERRRGRSGLGVLLGVAATATTGGAAFLGGHLAYRRGVGVDTTAFQSGPADWTQLQVDGEVTAASAVRARLDGVAFAVVGGAGPAEPPHVLEDRCTHRGGPLHEGDVADGCITCPWHGSRFDLATGEVRSGPASAPQPLYEVRTAGNSVSIRRSEPGGLRRNIV